MSLFYFAKDIIPYRIKRPFDTVVIDSMVIGIPPAGISAVSLGNTGRG